MSSKKKVIQGFSTIARFLPTSLLLSITDQPLIFPFFHTVSNASLAHLKHLYPIKDNRAFVKDLDFLLKHYQPISLEDLLSSAAQEKPIRKPSFLLSFDDGLKEFHEIIAPILLKKGIPASCFLNSAFIDNKALFYRYKASLLIEHISSKHELLSKIGKGTTVSSFSKELLAIDYNNRQRLDEIAKLLEYDFEIFLTNETPYLTTEQIHSLIQKGFHFGAHSIDHPEYQSVSLQEQLRQTRESIKFVQDKFQLDYSVFSFPFTDHGVNKKFFDQLEHDKTTDLTFGSAGLKKEAQKNHFQRVPFEVNKLSGKSILNTELFYSLLKAPLGKNRIKRK